MRFLSLLLLCTLLGAEERLGLDPVLRGLWILHAVSNDKGATIEPCDTPVEFAIATATTISFGDDKRLVKRVIITEDTEGSPANMALLDSGRWLAFTKKPGDKYVLIQIFNADSDGLTELTRLLITVHE